MSVAALYFWFVVWYVDKTLYNQLDSCPKAPIILFADITINLIIDRDPAVQSCKG